MSNPDDGTTDFQVGGLRDLLEGTEAGPPKGGGGGPNRQMLLIGCAVAAVAIVLVAVLLLAGGDDGDGGSDAPDDAVGVGVELRKGSGVDSRVREGGKASVCDTAVGPIAEGVVVNKISTGRQLVGGETVIVEVLASPEQASKLGAKPTSTWRAFASSTCPPANTTTSSSAPPPDTAPPATPSDSVPTPPPSS